MQPSTPPACPKSLFWFYCLFISSFFFFFHISAAQTPRETAQQCKTFISHQNYCYQSPQMWLLGHVLCRAVRGNVLLVASSAFTCFKCSTFLNLWWFRRRLQSDCQSKTLFLSVGWLQQADLDISTPHWKCCMAREGLASGLLFIAHQSLWQQPCVCDLLQSPRAPVCGNRSLTTWRGDLVFNSSGEGKKENFNRLGRLIHKMCSVITPDGKCLKSSMNECFCWIVTLWPWLFQILHIWKKGKNLVGVRDASWMSTIY